MMETLQMIRHSKGQCRVPMSGLSGECRVFLGQPDIGKPDSRYQEPRFLRAMSGLSGFYRYRDIFLSGRGDKEIGSPQDYSICLYLPRTRQTRHRGQFSAFVRQKGRLLMSGSTLKTRHGVGLYPTLTINQKF